jgi:hypothetical protein
MRHGCWTCVYEAAKFRRYDNRIRSLTTEFIHLLLRYSLISTMRSLKRSRNDPPELYTRTGRKKIRSNNLAESPHLPLDRHLDALIESTVVNLPAQSISSTVPIRCIHKLCYSCSLSESICCACVDKRPISTSYPPNIYRRGSHGTTDVRSEWYCPGCKGTSSTTTLHMSSTKEGHR